MKKDEFPSRFSIMVGVDAVMIYLVLRDMHNLDGYPVLRMFASGMASLFINAIFVVVKIISNNRTK